MRRISLIRWFTLVKKFFALGISYEIGAAIINGDNDDYKNIY